MLAQVVRVLCACPQIAVWIVSTTTNYDEPCRWYYAKGMQEDECYVFVCYDSRQGRARFTPHSGFKDPSTAEDADVRWSVEARAYCFWEHDPPAAPAQDL